MRIYETWSEIGQNEVSSMTWLGPGFHSSYLGVQPKISVLFCQWFRWSHSRFLPLWMRWVFWPFPAELRSPLLLWFRLYPTFSSGMSSPPFSYLFRLLNLCCALDLGSEDLVGFSEAGNLRLDSQAFPDTMVNTSLGDFLAVGQEGCSWPKTPDTTEGFCKLVVDYDKWLSQGRGWRSFRKLPLGFGLAGVLEKCTLCPESNVPQMWFSQLLSSDINFYYC